MIDITSNNNSPYPFAIPIIDTNLKNSAKYLPDLHLIGVPYYASILLAYSIFKNGMLSKLKYRKLLTETQIPSNIADFANKYIENYDYLVVYSQKCLDEFEERFGYQSKLVDVIDWFEYNEPALNSCEFFGKEREYIGLEKINYLELNSMPKEQAVFSWINFLSNSHSFTLYYENSEKPSMFKYIKPTEDNIEQNKKCIEYLTLKINKSLF